MNCTRLLFLFSRFFGFYPFVFSHRTVLINSGSDAFIGVLFGDFFQFAFDVFFECFRHFFGRVVRAAEWFADDAVYEAEIQHVVGVQFQRFGRPFFEIPGVPKDRGAGFRGDHRVPGIFEHKHLIAQADAQCAAGSAFADDIAEYGYAQLGHFEEISGDGFRLSALFGLESGESAGRINKRDDRESEAFGQFHKAERFAVSFRVGHAEVAVLAHFRVHPFLVADEHDRLPVQVSEAAHDGVVIAPAAVAVQFDFDFDFGFSTVAADEIPNEKLGTEVEQLQAQLAEQKAKTTAVINAVMPLLNNLAKNPENEYILWPNRVAKIDEFKKKLLSLQ